MNVKGCYRHPMNRLALGFFIAALVCFVVFHFASMEGNGKRGWTIWSEIYKVFSRGHWRALMPSAWFGIGSFLGMAFLVVTGPFLTPVICSNAVVRWLLRFISFAAFAGFSAFLVLRSGRLVLFWLFASQALHLLACLCIRRPKPEEFVPAPHLDA